MLHFDQFFVFLEIFTISVTPLRLSAKFFEQLLHLQNLLFLLPSSLRLSCINAAALLALDQEEIGHLI